MQQGIEQFLKDAESLHSGDVPTSKLFAKYRNAPHFVAAIKTIVRVDNGYQMIVEKYSKVLEDLKSNVEDIVEIMGTIEKAENVIREEKAQLSATEVVGAVSNQGVIPSSKRKKANRKKIKK